ncbi:hypothetical protein CMV_028759 [Castanea mollissima]|uniref:Uncharacterized protein n=1 Tax=Castanea mollissima TaxID=60419 RepID=A0A8J4VBQ3_9ROSI|nr:hypothetical protein CMV_028759 [Castanea mollissima]
MTTKQNTPIAPNYFHISNPSSVSLSLALNSITDLISLSHQLFSFRDFFFWAFKNHVKVQNVVAYLESENVILPSTQKLNCQEGYGYSS